MTSKYDHRRAEFGPTLVMADGEEVADLVRTYLTEGGPIPSFDPEKNRELFQRAISGLGPVDEYTEEMRERLGAVLAEAKDRAHQAAEDRADDGKAGISIAEFRYGSDK